jgi:hypothetical protein
MIPFKFYFVVAIVGACIAVIWWARYEAYNRGHQAAMQAVERSNIDARNKAETERRRIDSGDDSRVRGFDRE